MISSVHSGPTAKPDGLQRASAARFRIENSGSTCCWGLSGRERAGFHCIESGAPSTTESEDGSVERKASITPPFSLGPKKMQTSREA